MITFSLKASRNYYTIYINGKMHLKFKKADFIGTQSYKEPATPQERADRGFKEYKYTVVFYFRSNSITCEYDTFEKWEQGLMLVDTQIK
jgi:hypothetical protein